MFNTNPHHKSNEPRWSYKYQANWYQMGTMAWKVHTNCHIVLPPFIKKEIMPSQYYTKDLCCNCFIVNICRLCLLELQLIVWWLHYVLSYLWCPKTIYSTCFIYNRNMMHTFNVPGNERIIIPGNESLCQPTKLTSQYSQVTLDTQQTEL